MARHCIVIPVPTVRKDVFVAVSAGYMVRGTNCDNVNKYLAIILQKRS
jgi:hypothetical protein